jgi:hypothetical protein
VAPKAVEASWDLHQIQGFGNRVLQHFFTSGPASVTALPVSQYTPLNTVKSTTYDGEDGMIRLK